MIPASPPTPDAENRSAGRRLDSWKEIAAHLKRSVRTVQRWEKDEGLPVHRHRHDKAGTVYAHGEEIDAWWRSRRSRLAPQTWTGSALEWFTSFPWRPRRSQAAMLVVGSGTLVLLMAVTGVVMARRWSSPRESTTGGLERLSIVVVEDAPPHSYLYVGGAGDLNGDGNDDAVFASVDAREVYVLLRGVASRRSSPLLLRQEADIVITTTVNALLGPTVSRDIDGDGLADLIISASALEPDSLTSTAPAYVLLGRRSWPRALALPRDADIIFGFGVAGDVRMGTCVGLGPFDVNGDGLEDVGLTAPEYSPWGRRSAGALFVLFGRRQWSKTIDVPSTADITILGARSGEGLMDCSAGDFNGDGRTDLATGASEATLWNLHGGRGRIHLFFGRPDWPRVIDSANEFDVRIEGGDRRLRRTPLLMDLDGDRIDDLVIGRPVALEGPAVPGEVAIWFGGARRNGTLSASRPDVTLRAGTPGSEFGSGIVAKDVDLDGVGDLVISEPRGRRLHAAFGRRNWERVSEAVPLVTLPAVGGMERFSIGDFNGDSRLEVALGAEDSKRTGRGWIVDLHIPVAVDLRPGYTPNYLFLPDGHMVAHVFGFSRAWSDQTDPGTVRLAGAAPTESRAGDFNGDGYADVQLHFDTASMRVTNEAKRLLLTGRTRAGLPIAGSDSIVIQHDDHERPPTRQR
ncbi:MAG: FG-GAP repeat protein [Acidobacteria bacterium]|nr:FG-GAP repeat protein [Acidobacteriota bacterium]